MVGPQTPGRQAQYSIATLPSPQWLTGTLWPLPTQTKARFIGQTLQVSPAQPQSCPEPPDPQEDVRFSGGSDTHSPTPRPCPPLHTPKSQKGVGPTLLLPCGAILDLRLECPSNPSAGSQATMLLVQNLRTHPQAQHPSFHRWHHFTYNILLIRFSLGTEERLITYISLSGCIFKKLCLLNSCFSVFVSCSLLLPIFSH